MSTPDSPVQADFRTRAKANDVPVARLIGFEAKEIASGQAAVTLAAGPQHANPMGTLHGGILCDIADAAMGMAFASTLAPKESFTTLELKINFFRPVWEAQGGRESGATRAEFRLRRVRGHRRTRPAHCQGGVDLSRVEGRGCEGALGQQAGS